MIANKTVAKIPQSTSTAVGNRGVLERFDDDHGGVHETS